jgi:hypothetical protein
LRYVGSYGIDLTRTVDYNQVNIRGNGFLEDYLRARANLANTGNAFCNPATTANCQALTLFGTAAGSRLRVANNTAGAVAVATFNNNLTGGTPADLAIAFVNGGATNGFPFLANPNSGVVNLLENGARYNYNAFQAELRRRFTNGLYFQANYTFQKTLTNAIGVSQTRVEPFLDNLNQQLDYSRAEYDATHVFNFNTIYDLPFGKGRAFLDRGGIVDKVLGGWQVTTILRMSTGAPLSISDPNRGTLNRAARSNRQTANSSLTPDQIKDLIGVFRTPCGVFYIDPSVVDINLSDCSGTGRAKTQFFTQAAPGTTGSLPRNFINGPLYANVDASILKNIRLTESVRMQLRVEAFNLLNRVNFGAVNGTNNDVTVATGQYGIFNINSSTFGRLQTTVGPVNNPSDTFRVIQFAGRFEF